MTAMNLITVLIDDVTCSDACVNWTLPIDIVKQDITHFSLQLWRDGTFKTIEELNKAAKGPIAFTEPVIDNK